MTVAVSVGVVVGEGVTLKVMGGGGMVGVLLLSADVVTLGSTVALRGSSGVSVDVEVDSGSVLVGSSPIPDSISPLGIPSNVGVGVKKSVAESGDAVSAGMFILVEDGVTEGMGVGVGAPSSVNTPSYSSPRAVGDP